MFRSYRPVRGAHPRAPDLSPLVPRTLYRTVSRNPQHRRSMMRTWILRLTIAVAFAVAIASPASAQQTGEITGTVRDSASGQPLPGAQILVPGTRIGTTVNVMGQYTLRNVPAGRTTVRAQRLGYALAERTVTVAAGATTTLDFLVSA